MEALAYVGCIFSFLAFAYPVFTMLDVRRAGSVGRRSMIPYVVALLACGLWTMYGFAPPQRDPIIARNVMGVPFQAAYVGVFLYYYAAADRVISLLYLAPALLGYSVLLAFHLCHALDKTLLACLCATTGSIASLLPLFNLRAVWRTRDIEGMPPMPLAGLTCIGGLIWTSYSYNGKPRDWFTVGPNGVAALSAAVQLLVHLVFCFRRPDTLAADETKAPLLDTSVPTPAGTHEGGAHGDDDDNAAAGVDEMA